jgi:sulfur relay (sulfurtransferase) DsrC/TusE family protein
MTEVKKGKSIDDNATLWRYISLEAFISLLETQSLFFTPTAYYEKTDPFEGLMPEVAMKAIASVSGKRLSKMQTYRKEIVNMVVEKDGVISEEHQKLIDVLDKSIEEYRVHPKNSYIALAKRTTVSCWHKNENESEAMWRLYSKNGIAIKTKFSSIVRSFENNGENHIIHVAPVKYIDFSNKELLPADCVTDGYIFPLIKRSSFSHEHEVRFFIRYCYHKIVLLNLAIRRKIERLSM